MENKNLINGIKCNVKNCVYHSMNDRCEAGEIEVGTCCDDCDCSSETACETFEPKE